MWKYTRFSRTSIRFLWLVFNIYDINKHILFRMFNIFFLGRYIQLRECLLFTSMAFCVHTYISRTKFIQNASLNWFVSYLLTFYLQECAHRFPVPLYGNDGRKQDKFILTVPQDHLKCVVTLTGDSISHAVSIQHTAQETK